MGADKAAVKMLHTSTRVLVQEQSESYEDLMQFIADYLLYLCKTKKLCGGSVGIFKCQQSNIMKCNISILTIHHIMA